MVKFLTQEHNTLETAELELVTFGFARQCIYPLRHTCPISLSFSPLHSHTNTKGCDMLHLRAYVKCPFTTPPPFLNTGKEKQLLLHDNPNTFSHQAYLMRNRRSNNGWFPRDSIRGPLAHQPPDPARQATACGCPASIFVPI